MGTRWWLHGLILIGLAGCGTSGGEEPAAEEGEAKAVAGEAHVVVQTEPARKGRVEEVVDGLGRCEALPDHLATLTPAVEGHVETLLVKQGDAVKRGQAIVELDKSVALADLAEKTATRDGLVATLKLLQSLPRAEERKSNELAIETAKVNVERAERIAERLRPLLSRHEISEQQMYEADQAVIQARLQQQTAEAQLRAMLIGPRPEAVAEAQAKISTADAAVAFSRAHLQFHTIRSPIDGVLDSLTCHPGQTIAVGSPIGEVVDTRQVFATVWLPPRKAHLVRVGQPARIKAAETGLDEPPAAEPKGEAEHDEDEKDKEKAKGKDQEKEKAEGDRKPAETPEPSREKEKEKAKAQEKPEPEELEGKVEFVGQVADAQTGSLPVRVLVDNGKGLLTLGQTLSVSIIIEVREDVLQVPAGAILDQGEGPIVNVVREGKTVVLHPEVGPAHNGWVPVSGTDLKEGEPVVIEGGYNLPEGTAVKSEPAKAVAQSEAEERR